MSLDTITLSLDGDVPLTSFAEVMGYFSALVKSLSDEVVGPDAIVWEISHLESGSAVATVRGKYDIEEDVERVVRAYDAIGDSLEQGKLIPYSKEVVKNAVAITSVLNGQITSVDFITDGQSHSIYQPVAPETAETGKIYSLGVITGEVRAIWSLPRLRIAVYDSLFGRLVHCYLDKDQKEKAREIWGKRVSISGLIFRDPDTGRPIDIRQIRDFEIVMDAAHKTFKEAKGIIAWREGNELSEVIIRRLRNGL